MEMLTGFKFAIATLVHPSLYYMNISRILNFAFASHRENNTHEDKTDFTVNLAWKLELGSEDFSNFINLI